MASIPVQPVPPPARIFQVEMLSVRVYASQSELVRDAAAMAQAHLRETLAAKNSAAVILATGNSQIQFLEVLTQMGGVDWSKITCFHMDEYLGIAAEHPASFRRYMRERVEQLVKPRVFHYLAGDAASPEAECERYAKLLSAQPIDLCCLGIGENGHLAFNDPPDVNFADPRAVAVVKLDDKSRQQQVGEGHFPNLEAVPERALTLTIPTLCSARKMLCIAPESRKASAVKEALQGPISPACPASFLRRQAHATLFLDQESASLLNR